MNLVKKKNCEQYAGENIKNNFEQRKPAKGVVSIPVMLVLGRHRDQGLNVIITDMASSNTDWTT